MDPLEILATAATIVCVALAVRRSIWQFPVGILATLLFLVVFWRAQLLSSAALQVFFSFVQIYGWWFWLYGDNGRAPRITSWPPMVIGVLCLGALVCAVALSLVLEAYTEAKMALADAMIFGLSVVAQFLLDRKKIENWAVWGVVDALSVWVYGAQGLWVAAALYAGLFATVFIGYWAWRKAAAREPAPAGSAA